MNNFKIEELENINFEALSVKEKNSIYSVASNLARYEMDSIKGTDVFNVESGKKLLRIRTMNLKQEVFGMILLDARHRLISFVDLFYGSLNSASIYPREIVRNILESGAGAVIIFHNHPSGDLTPSSADINITARIKSALETIDVSLLDHYIAGKEGVASLASLNLM